MELLSAIMKGVKAPSIEIEVEDCEEYTATFSFYVISGSNLSQVHMVVENLEATEEGCSPIKGKDILGRRCEDHDKSPSSDRRMTTSRDTSDGVRVMI